MKIKFLSIFMYLYITMIILSYLIYVFLYKFILIQNLSFIYKTVLNINNIEYKLF
jgi:hypothetical protein